nr:Bdr family repetitive protein [Borrelia sp. BU AG58]
MQTQLKPTTEQIMLEELIRMGMKQPLAMEFANRYFHNELTYRDLENLEKNFNIRFENLEEKIANFKNELKSKIDTVKNELNSKIDTKGELVRKDIEMTKIELKGTLRLHNWMTSFLLAFNVAILLAIYFK